MLYYPSCILRWFGNQIIFPHQLPNHRYVFFHIQTSYLHCAGAKERPSLPCILLQTLCAIKDGAASGPFPADTGAQASRSIAGASNLMVKETPEHHLFAASDVTEESLAEPHCSASQNVLRTWVEKCAKNVRCGTLERVQLQIP